MGLAFSPDGSQLAIPFGARSARVGGIEVRDIRGGERLARLRSDGQVRSVAFSPDGRMLAGGQLDGNIVLWETDGWRRLGTPLASRSGEALSVAFSPDGRTLATSHATGAVVLWDVAAQLPIGSPLPGPDDWVTARFTPNGSRLFAVYDTGNATRWEVDPAAWIRHACAIAGGLTPEQWAEVVPEQDYISVCPSGAAG